MTSLLRRMGERWRSLFYRNQTEKRLDKGIHRASAASRRSCAHCLRGIGGPASLFKHCQNNQLLVHRRDTCRQFVLRHED